MLRKTISKTPTLVNFNKYQLRSKKSMGHAVRDFISDVGEYMRPLLRVLFPSFIAVHYFYIIFMTLFQSLLMFPVEGQKYIDILLISASTTSQGGLNTININSMTLYQQIVIYVVCCATTPIFIHSTLAFVRLYWFERYFDGIRDWSKRNFKTRRTRTLLQREMTGDQAPVDKLQRANTGLTFSLTRGSVANGESKRNKISNSRRVTTNDSKSRRNNSNREYTEGHTNSMVSQHTNTDFQSRLFRGEMVKREEDDDEDEKEDYDQTKFEGEEPSEGNESSSHTNNDLSTFVPPEDESKNTGLQLQFDIPDKPKNHTTSTPLNFASGLGNPSSKKGSSKRKPSFISKLSFLNTKGSAGNDEEYELQPKTSRDVRSSALKQDRSNSYAINNYDGSKDEALESDDEDIDHTVSSVKIDTLRNTGEEVDYFNRGVTQYGSSNKADNTDLNLTRIVSTHSDSVVLDSQHAYTDGDDHTHYSTEDISDMKIKFAHNPSQMHEHKDLDDLVTDPEFQKQLYKKWKKEHKSKRFFKKAPTLNWRNSKPNSNRANSYENRVDSEYADMYRNFDVDGLNTNGLRDDEYEDLDAFNSRMHLGNVENAGRFQNDDDEVGYDNEYNYDAEEEGDEDEDYDDEDYDDEDYDDEDYEDDDEDDENDVYEGNLANNFVTIGRNSTFVGLTHDQKEELGGVEYRALKLLCKVLAWYYIGFHALGVLLFVPWINNKSQAAKYQGVLASDGVNNTWWGFFTSMSSFNDLGLTLTPDSMASFSHVSYILIFTMIFIILGNTGFPVFLRFIIWFLSKISPDLSQRKESLGFLLEHPRRCFTLLFPKGPTWWLFFILVILNLFDWVMFLILDFNSTVVKALGGAWYRVLNGLFQGVCTRTAGFTSMNISALAPAIQVSYMLMMYVSVMPLAISIRRTNVYEEQSLGFYHDGNDRLKTRTNSVSTGSSSYSNTRDSFMSNDSEGNPRQKGHGSNSTGSSNSSILSENDLENQDEYALEHSPKSFIGMHLRKQLSFDLWFLFSGLFIIAICEGEAIKDINRPYFTIWTVLFEVVSAYGTVGLSMGYPNTDTSFCAQFSTISKLVIILLLIRGKHRGLPYSLDRAIMLPSDKLQNFDDRILTKKAHEDILGSGGTGKISYNSVPNGPTPTNTNQHHHHQNQHHHQKHHNHHQEHQPSLTRANTINVAGNGVQTSGVHMVVTGTTDPVLAYWKKKGKEAKSKVQATSNALFHNAPSQSELNDVTHNPHHHHHHHHHHQNQNHNQNDSEDTSSNQPHFQRSNTVPLNSLARDPQSLLDSAGISILHQNKTTTTTNTNTTTTSLGKLGNDKGTNKHNKHDANLRKYSTNDSAYAHYGESDYQPDVAQQQKQQQKAARANNPAQNNNTNKENELDFDDEFQNESQYMQEQLDQKTKDISSSHSL